MKYLFRLMPVLIMPLLLAACAVGTIPALRSTGASTPAAQADEEIPAFPYTRPLPPAVASPIDGVYAKVDPDPATPTPCRRCAEYRLEGGVWLLDLQKGTFRVDHKTVGWKSNGSFTVEGDRLTVFNDPSCTEDVGIYTWKVVEGKLTLQVIQDDCAIGLRAKNLMQIPWASCSPPSREAAISGHWKVPEGC